MKTHIVDTNVILVANGLHSKVDEECVLACRRKLTEIVEGGRVSIDEHGLILTEYGSMTRPWAGKREGDVFLKWLLQNQGNPSRCDRVALTEHSTRGFESFPDHPDLEDFDKSDRKFVAVAAAHGHKPPIAQAADSKWLGWAPALLKSGITVEFLCPGDIKRFDANKKARKQKR